MGYGELPDHFPYIIFHFHFPFVIRRFNLEVQRRPEGPLANSHAREGVEQAIKLIPRCEGPADD